MSLHFSEYPGRRERHLRRKQDNPLFPEQEREISESALEAAQKLDHEELVAFISDFRKLVQEAFDLKPNEGSEVILRLKERLDQAYEQAAGLADDQTETRDAIKKLLAIIMSTVRNGARDDPTAQLELAQEEQARATHFELLQHPLVADLLDPASVIAENELAATLLSASRKELDAVLILFDQEQLTLLCAESERLLDVADHSQPSAIDRLQQMREHLEP